MLNGNVMVTSIGSGCGFNAGFHIHVPPPPPLPSPQVPTLTTMVTQLEMDRLEMLEKDSLVCSYTPFPTQSTLTHTLPFPPNCIHM